MRRVLFLLLLLPAAIGTWWVWHVRTVNHPTLIAPKDVVPQPRALISEAIDVWIDTDPACGVSARHDVDDCWALALALRSGRLRVRGISTTFGNTDIQTATQIAREVVARFATAPIEVVPGAARSGDVVTRAPDAIAAALRVRHLTILSLGPATNIAALLQRHPSLADRIDRIVVIAGSTPDVGLFPVGDRHIIHAHDQNFRRDVDAFRVLLDRRRPLVLIPYATATKVTIDGTRLDAFGARDANWKWLGEKSGGWLRYWKLVSGENGFWPFDAVAVCYLIEPDAFRCMEVPAQIRRDLPHSPQQFLHVSAAFDRGWVVTYCGDVAADVLSPARGEPARRGHMMNTP